MPIIRRASAVHADAMQQLYECVVGTAEWLPPEAKVGLDFRSASEGESVFVSTDRCGTLEGILSVYEPQAFIHHLYVAPQYQRRGVGTALLASLENWLPKPWRLKCVRANRAALAFYAARGWSESGRGIGKQGAYIELTLS